MTTKTPPKSAVPPLTPPNSPPPKSAPNQFQTGDWLTIATILLTISAAIFYFAGWVYEAYWYSFFGINLTQMNIPLQQIMIEGLPGIVIIAISLLVATLVVSLLFIGKKDNKKDSSFVWIIIIAYGVSVFIVFLIGVVYREFLSPIPVEIVFSSLGVVFVFTVLTSLQFFRQNRISRLLDATKEISPLLINIALTSLSFSPIVGGLSDALGKLGQDVISDVIDNIKKEYPKRGAAIAIDIINAWRLWIGLVILFFILLSLTTSAILGRANAHLGQRLMMGGWQMNETFIYSSKSNLPLPRSPDTNEDGYEYGPFGLIANDDQVYYLADWKTGDHYVSRPNLYTLPRSNDTSLIILFVPESTPTPTPLPTLTPNPSPTITLSFTATSLSTLTPKP